MEQKETKESLASLQDELDGAMLYQALADQEKDPKIAEVYRRMSATEGRHAATWTERLKAAGTAVPAYKPSWRTRTMVWLSRRFGAGFVLPSIVNQEPFMLVLERDGVGQAIVAQLEQREIEIVVGNFRVELDGAAKFRARFVLLPSLEKRHTKQLVKRRRARKLRDGAARTGNRGLELTSGKLGRNLIFKLLARLRARGSAEDHQDGSHGQCFSDGGHPPGQDYSDNSRHKAMLPAAIVPSQFGESGLGACDSGLSRD